MIRNILDTIARKPQDRAFELLQGCCCQNCYHSFIFHKGCYKHMDQKYCYKYNKCSDWEKIDEEELKMRQSMKNVVSK